MIITVLKDQSMIEVIRNSEMSIQNKESLLNHNKSFYYYFLNASCTFFHTILNFQNEMRELDLNLTLNLESS